MNVNNNYESPTPTQARYWQLMVESTVHDYYLQIYLLSSQKMDRNVMCFLAIMSSTAIASWAIWKNWSYVWAFLIALSQVINAIKHLLPYAQREKMIRSVLPDLSKISSDMELEYYNVANGLMSDQEIHNKTVKFKDRKNSIISKLNECALPENSKFMAEAEEKTKIYLRGYYGD